MVAFAILALSFICFGIATLGTVPLWADNPNNSWMPNVLAICLALICWLLGGLIVGSKVGHRGALHGLLVGLISSIILVIFSIAMMLSARVGSGEFIGVLAAELLVLPGLSTLGGALGAWWFRESDETREQEKPKKWYKNRSVLKIAVISIVLIVIYVISVAVRVASHH